MIILANPDSFLTILMSILTILMSILTILMSILTILGTTLIFMVTVLTIRKKITNTGKVHHFLDLPPFLGNWTLS